MGAQLQNVLSQVELNKATAKKTEAEAEKIAGADTKVAERLKVANWHRSESVKAMQGAKRYQAAKGE